MFENTFNDSFWQYRGLRNQLRGVALEEPDEELESLYNDLVNDVEVFTQAEFDEVPELWVVSENSRRQMKVEGGAYFEDANAIVHNPQILETWKSQKQPKPDSEPMRRLHESMENLTEKNILLEEITHGLQDQQTGVANLDHSARDHFARKLGFKTIPN